MAEFDATAGGLPGMPLPARGTDVAIVSRNGVQLFRLDLRDWPLSNPVAQAIAQRLGPSDLATINGQSLVQPGGNIVISGGGSGGGTWGSITGTLADQTDLQNALNARPVFADFATINGQPITEGGNIVVEVENTNASLGAVGGSINVSFNTDTVDATLSASDVSITLVDAAPGKVTTCYFTNTGAVTRNISFATPGITFVANVSNVIGVPPLQTAVFSIRVNPDGSSFFCFVNAISYQVTANADDTIWNSSDTSTELALTNSGTTVEMTVSAATSRSTRAFGVKTTGKWLFVIRCDTVPSAQASTLSFAIMGVGVSTTAATLNTLVGTTVGSGSIVFSRAGQGSGQPIISQTTTRDENVTTTRAAITLAVSDFVMVAFDASTGNGWVGHNGAWLYGGNPETGATPAFSVTPGQNFLPMLSMREDAGANAGVFTIMNSSQVPAILASAPSFQYWTS